MKRFLINYVLPVAVIYLFFWLFLVALMLTSVFQDISIALCLISVVFHLCNRKFQIIKKLRAVSSSWDARK